MLEMFLGGYSLLLLVVAVLAHIANNSLRGGRRLLAVLMTLPVLIYVCMTFFD